MPTFNQIFKRQQYNEKRDFDERAKKFHEEYKTLVEKFDCDFGAFLEPIGDGKGAVAKLHIIDAKDRQKENENQGEDK